MNLFISENIDQGIEGFVTIPIIYGEIDLSKIPNNAASEIVAIDALDSIKYENVQKFIKDVASKMRLDSVLHLGGLDAYALSTSLINGSIDLKTFNNSISDVNGIYSAQFIIDLLHTVNLKIESAIYKGDRYEIKSTRPKN